MKLSGLWWSTVGIITCTFQLLSRHANAAAASSILDTALM